MIEGFLITAKLGGLSLGLSKAEVRRQLGEPADHSQRNGKTEIWKYGGLEIAFNKGSLYFIGLYFENGTVMLPNTLLEDGVIRIEKCLVDDVEKFLLDKRIDFTVDKNLTFDQQKYLRVTKSQVGICFVQGQLHSIQLTG
ncbi:MAG TPA: hypothetical protein VJ023_18835 [Pyrinomonadaceae bacterium]|nr:hypothetical protein [Pyrinomonadaceae bacterium]